MPHRKTVSGTGVRQIRVETEAWKINNIEAATHLGIYCYHLSINKVISITIQDNTYVLCIGNVIVTGTLTMDFGEAADCSCLTFMVVFPFDYEYAIHLHTYEVIGEIKDKEFIAQKVFHL